MLIFDMKEVGLKIQEARQRTGKTQTEIAEIAGLSGRAYADIERGCVNMRLGSFLHICNALSVTPDELLIAKGSSLSYQQEELWNRLIASRPYERNVAFQLLSAYLQSLE